MVLTSAVDHASAGPAVRPQQEPAEPRPGTNGVSGSQARRIAEGSYAIRHVASDHTTRADHRIVANAHARKNNCATADPHITPDADRATKLQPGPPRISIAWVIGGEDLNPWPDLSPVS